MIDVLVPYVKNSSDDYISTLSGFRTISGREVSHLSKTEKIMWFKFRVGQRKVFKGSVKKLGTSIIFNEFDSTLVNNKNIRDMVDKFSKTNIFNTDVFSALLLFVRQEKKQNEPFIIESLFVNKDDAKDFCNHINTFKGVSAYAVVNNTVLKNEAVEKRSIKEDFFIIEDGVNKTLSFADKMAKESGYANILITGQSGFGKTTIARRFAEKTGRKFVKVDLALVAEASDFLGSMQLVNGTTNFVDTPFSKAIEEGNHVILLDEINRAYANTTNPLLGLLDDTHTVSFNGRQYSVAPNTVFIVTANIGFQYTGTFKADAALMNRMNLSVSVGDIRIGDEAEIYANRCGLSSKDAKDIASFLFECRKTIENTEVDFSPRSGIALGKIISYGATLRYAVDMVFAVSVEDKKSMLDILSRTGNFDSSSTLPLLF